MWLFGSLGGTGIGEGFGCFLSSGSALALLCEVSLSQTDPKIRYVGSSSTWISYHRPILRASFYPSND